MKNLMFFALAICMMATVTSCNYSDNSHSEESGIECFQLSWEVSDVEEDAIVKIYYGPESIDSVDYNLGYIIATGPVDEYRLEKETNHSITPLSYTCESYGIMVSDDVIIVLSVDTTEVTHNYDSIKYYLVCDVWSPDSFTISSDVNVVEYYHDSTNRIYTKEYPMKSRELFW